MHATHVVEGKNWYNQRIAPEGKSFTYMWILRFFSIIIAVLLEIWCIQAVSE